MSTTTTNKIKLTAIYTDYEERTFNIPNNWQPEDYASIKSAIANFNTAAASIGSSVNQTFVSNGGASIARIKAAEVIETTEEVIYSA